MYVLEREGHAHVLYSVDMFEIQVLVILTLVGFKQPLSYKVIVLE
jgi:hypothetical protein